MRVLRKLLIALGVAFAALVVFIGWAGFSSSRFQAAQTPFVTQFVTDLSRRWEFADVHDRLSTEFMQQATTAQAQQALQQFRSLGSVRSMKDLELRSFTVSPTVTSALFSLKATFDFGQANIDLRVIKKDNAVRVLSFYLYGISRPGSTLSPNIQT